ncbi:MAG: hypothetical protein RIQ33_382 [Bacteroidota bacterium]|jgi:hypothetical protein
MFQANPSYAFGMLMPIGGKLSLLFQSSALERLGSKKYKYLVECKL